MGYAIPKKSNRIDSKYTNSIFPISLVSVVSGPKNDANTSPDKLLAYTYKVNTRMNFELRSILPKIGRLAATASERAWNTSGNDVNH